MIVDLNHSMSIKPSPLVRTRLPALRLFRIFLIVSLCVTSVCGFLTLRSLAQSDRTDPERQFNKKADKMLQRVRHASIRDRASGKGLRKETSEVERLRPVVGIDRTTHGDVVSVLVKLSGSDVSEIQAAGFAVSGAVGDIATLEVEVEKLPKLASLDSVQKLSAAVFRYPSNDRARRSSGVEDVFGNRVVTQTGKGIIVGVIDTGIDFRHLDFTLPGSSGTRTRIKALLDMTVYGGVTPDPGWNYSLPGQSAVIGHLYTENDINSALGSPKPADQESDSVKQRDKNGHGTHVAGTAAGNGVAAPVPGTYAGIAPEADLIIVKATRQNDGTATFRNSDVVNALQFVLQQAALLSEPFVVNLSLGGQSGPHDGTTPDERAIDNLVNGGTGRAVCVSAGNDGDTKIHASATVPAAGTVQLNFNAVNKPSFVDLYQAFSDRFTVTVTRPDGVTLGPVAYDPNGFQMTNGQASDQYVQVFNANDDKGDADPTNDQPDIFLMFKPGALTGQWSLTLTDADSNPNQSFDAWAGGTDVNFTNLLNNSHLVSAPGNAREAITVGTYVTRSSTLLLGGFTPYSSPGPTADGRQKPDLEAPGHYLYSTKSTDITNSGVVFIDPLPAGDFDAATDYVHYGGLAGTSMAAPVVAGGVALLLQSLPSLNGEQIKNSLTQSTNPDRFTAPGWNSVSGYGQLNVSGAIALGGRKTFSISGHITNSLPAGFMTVNLTGSKTSAASVNSSGNYSFSRLIEGGTYTVTPSVSSAFNYIFSPASYTFSNLDSDKIADFTATASTFNVSGIIRDSNLNPVEGVQVSSQRFSGGT